MAQIGKYEIVGEAGTGIFGTVYEAKDSKSGAAFALRVLPKKASPPMRNRLVIETFPAARAKQIVDCGAAGESLFIASPWIDGTPLNKLDPLPSIPERIEILARAAEALATIHGSGALHRNLHPGNVMLGRDGTVAITDATLAFIGCGEALGRKAPRLDYLAPEQFLGGPLDGRTDLFALAVIGYEFLSGVHPFPGEGRARAITEENPRSLRTLDRSFTESFDLFFGKALSKDPSQRYGSAPEMSADLRQLEWIPVNKKGKKALLIAKPKAKVDVPAAAKADPQPAPPAPDMKPAVPRPPAVNQPGHAGRWIAISAIAAGVAAAAVFVANRGDKVSAEPSIATASISAAAVLRELPDVNAKVVGRASKGMVTILSAAPSHGWLRAQARVDEGVTPPGWVRAAELQSVESASLETAMAIVEAARPADAAADQELASYAAKLAPFVKRSAAARKEFARVALVRASGMRAAGRAAGEWKPLLEQAREGADGAAAAEIGEMLRAANAPPAPAEPVIDAPRLLRLAESSFTQGNYRSAMSIVNSVLDSQPDNADAKRWKTRIAQAQAAEAKLSQ